jgi:hypothetical protein
MNIKPLIIAATAVSLLSTSLLSTQAFAFRDEGDSGGDSAFAIPPNERGMGNNGGWYRPNAATDAYASAPITRAHRPVHNGAHHRR